MIAGTLTAIYPICKTFAELSKKLIVIVPRCPGYAVGKAVIVTSILNGVPQYPANGSEGKELSETTKPVLAVAVIESIEVAQLQGVMLGIVTATV